MSPHLRDAVHREKLLSMFLWSRPAMAALRNILHMLLNWKQLTDAALESLISHIREQSNRTIYNALKLLPSGATIGTISYSSLVFEICSEGKKQGKNWKILCYSSPYGQHDYGAQFYQKCRTEGIEATFVHSPADSTISPEVLLFGADTVAPTYGIINGTPTYRICAHFFYYIPLLCCAESFKKNDTLIVEPGFDFIPWSFSPVWISDKETTNICCGNWR